MYNRFKDTVYKEGGNHWSEKEHGQTGPNGLCVLEPNPDAKQKADKLIRAVGLREEGIRKKIRQSQEKGCIEPSQSHWVSRGCLVPTLGSNQSRVVIHYRYVNPQLRSCEFLLPVMRTCSSKRLEIRSGPSSIPRMGFT